MPKKNIVMIGQKMVPSRDGGIETVVTILAPILVKDGFNVLCINRNLKANNIKDYQQDSEGNNFYKGVKLKKAFTLNVKGLSAVTSSFFATLFSVIKKKKVDVIHYHAEGPALWIWIPRIFKIKTIVTIHGLDWKRDKWHGGIGAKYIKFAEKLISKYATHIIVLNKDTEKYFFEVYNRKTIYIPNGVQSPEYKKLNLLKRYGLTKGNYICSVSRLTKEKGIHLLIKAFNNIDTEKKLVIAGDSSDTEDYKKYLYKLASRNSNIIFTGFLNKEELQELYSNSYSFIIPSNLEGMPMALLEAMSYGNCVIGSDIKEIYEVIEDKGILFKNGNIKDLEKKLRFIIKNPEVVESYSKATSAYVLQKYNWNEIAEKTENLYLK